MKKKNKKKRNKYMKKKKTKNNIQLHINNQIKKTNKNKK